MIIPINNKILVSVEKVKDVEDKGGFKVVKTQKDSLMKGVVKGTDYGSIEVGMTIYFSAYGFEQVGDDVLIDFDQVWAYER